MSAGTKGVGEINWLVIMAKGCGDGRVRMTIRETRDVLRETESLARESRERERLCYSVWVNLPRILKSGNVE